MAHSVFILSCSGWRGGHLVNCPFSFFSIHRSFADSIVLGPLFFFSEPRRESGIRNGARDDKRNGGSISSLRLFDRVGLVSPDISAPCTTVTTITTTSMLFRPGFRATSVGGQCTRLRPSCRLLTAREAHWLTGTIHRPLLTARLAMSAKHSPESSVIGGESHSIRSLSTSERSAARPIPNSRPGDDAEGQGRQTAIG